jgi:hypothetical protein
MGAVKVSQERKTWSGQSGSERQADSPWVCTFCYVKAEVPFGEGALARGYFKEGEGGEGIAFV